MSQVDVIVPCYKYAHFLRECVDSVLSQSHRDLRVLIIDDASPDDTEAVASQLVAQDCRVQYRRHRVNAGHIATYNEGLEWAAGEYTLLLSADDLLMPGALHRAVHFFSRHPEVGMTYGQAIVMHGQASENAAYDCKETSEGWVIHSSRFVESLCEEAGNPIPTPTVVVRTNLQKTLGGYRADLPHAGDLEMWLRFAAFAPIGFVDNFQAYYRKHIGNMHTTYFAVRGFEQKRAAFRVFFDDQGHWIEDSERLRSLAYRRLAEEAFWVASLAFDRNEIETCNAHLRFAEETNPEIVSWKPYVRLRWKFAAGPRVWAFVRPIWDRIRIGTQA